MSHNKIRKLTEGSMFLAIVASFLLVDRQFGFFFQDIVIVLIPSVIALYSLSWSFKDGCTLSFCYLVIALLFGNVNSYIYFPVSIIVGLSLAYLLKKGVSLKIIILIVIAIYLASEFFVCFVVYPAIGIPLESQMSGSIKLMDKFGLSGLQTWLIVSFIITIVSISVIEGCGTIIFSDFLFKRFKNHFN